MRSLFKSLGILLGASVSSSPYAQPATNYAAIAQLRWYAANQTAQFPTGSGPVLPVFDGARQTHAGPPYPRGFPGELCYLLFSSEGNSGAGETHSSGVPNLAGRGSPQ